MDRGLKLVLTAVVLLVGVTAALAWRRHGNSPGQPATTPAVESLVLRQRTVAAPAGVGRLAPSGAIEAPAASRPRATIRAHLEDDSPPPQLARLYPQPDDAAVAAALGPVEENRALPLEGRTALRLHKVIDGDTLPELAQRYLGSPTRWAEIFEANRSVLASPEALPIGAELRIPPRRAPAPAEPALPRRRALVPIADAEPADEPEPSLPGATGAQP